jgi:thioredoxin 1
MSDKVSHLTSATFDEVVNGAAEPVIVDFWAEWCGPCKMVAPILDEIADEMDGSVKVTKLNVDENADVAQRFGVMSIPTLLMFRDGELTNRVVGAKGKAQLLEELGLV